MERFNYPNLAAVDDEDVSILQLLELESFGDRGDEIDKLRQLEYEAEMSDKYE